MDWSFGIGALILLGFLLAPALLESRDAARAIVCQDNLRWFGRQLFDYQQRRGDHQLPIVEPGEHAGMFFVRLAEQGGIDCDELGRRMLCPNALASDQQLAWQDSCRLRSSDELAFGPGARQVRLVHSPTASFAAPVGYFDKQGVYHPVRFTGARGRPMMADAPDLSQPSWGSSNHVGGQYVLNQSMAVRFVADSGLDAGGDHIYRNAAGYHASACSPDDKVLILINHGPMGPYAPTAFDPLR